MPTSPRPAVAPRRLGPALLLVMVLALAGTLVPSGAAIARPPDRDGLSWGAVGDVSAIRARTHHKYAVHGYGYFEGHVPHGRMITVRFRHFQTWRHTASLSRGSADWRRIAAWADVLKHRRGTPLVAFHHEPEASGSEAYGTPADFRAAFRKVVSIFRARGATNVAFTWQMTSYAFLTPRGARNYAPAFYPGDAYVDVVSVDAYNFHRCGPGRGRWKSLRDLALPALKFARHHHKQFALGEMGAVRDARRPAWIRSAGTWLKRQDRTVVAAFYFNRAPTNPANADCTWTLRSRADHAAMGTVVRRPGVRP